MGATNFERIAFGKTVWEAFKLASNEAEEERGDQDGYSGDLNSKHSYLEVLVPKGVSPKKYYHWIEQVSYILYDHEKDKKRLMKSIPQIHHSALIRYAKIYDDKWGKALAIEVKGKEAQEFRNLNGLKGKQGKVWRFFGLAPE